MIAWRRNLLVKLTSKKLNKSFVFGGNEDINKEDLNIQCIVYKYMSALKDTATVKIVNLTYNEVTQLVMGEFYDIEIYAGYKSLTTNCIFKGGVLYISNQLNNDRTNTIIILCASEMVAKYGQQRMNLTLNSGINLYSAINFICRRAGLQNSNVSTQFKKQFLEEVLTVNTSATSWIDSLMSSNNTSIVNSDSILGQTFSIFDAAKSNNRIIKLTSSNITLTNGVPQLDTDGLSLTMLPTFNFMCGDVIKIDNSILNISASNLDEVVDNRAAQFNQKGEYMIYEMQYVLQNHGNAFQLKLNCKNREKISQFVGGD